MKYWLIQPWFSFIHANLFTLVLSIHTSSLTMTLAHTRIRTIISSVHSISCINSSRTSHSQLLISYVSILQFFIQWMKLNYWNWKKTKEKEKWKTRKIKKRKKIPGKKWASILCGPRIPSSVSITDVYNIIIINFNICGIIISNTKGVTPLTEGS